VAESAQLQGCSPRHLTRSSQKTQNKSQPKEKDRRHSSQGCPLEIRRVHGCSTASTTAGTHPPPNQSANTCFSRHRRREPSIFFTTQLGNQLALIPNYLRPCPGSCQVDTRPTVLTACFHIRPVIHDILRFGKQIDFLLDLVDPHQS